MVKEYIAIFLHHGSNGGAGKASDKSMIWPVFMVSRARLQGNNTGEKRCPQGASCTRALADPVSTRVDQIRKALRIASTDTLGCRLRRIYSAHSENLIEQRLPSFT